MDPPCSRARIVVFTMMKQKSVVHSVMDVRIAPVGNSELLRSALFVGSVRRIPNDETKTCRSLTKDSSSRHLRTPCIPMFAGAVRHIPNDETEKCRSLTNECTDCCSRHLRAPSIPLFAGAVRRILNDKTEKLKLVTRSMQIKSHIALLCHCTVSQSRS